LRRYTNDLLFARPCFGERGVLRTQWPWRSSFQKHKKGLLFLKCDQMAIPNNNNYDDTLKK
jgi:hypothetical protein